MNRLLRLLSAAVMARHAARGPGRRGPALSAQQLWRRASRPSAARRLRAADRRPGSMPATAGCWPSTRAQNRIFVPIEAIPERLKQAFVAAEDKNFYSHPGIDLFGIARAMVSNLQRIGDNRRPEGASTITQQVAKNFLLSNELSYQRKLKEMLLALRMERAFTKDRILELYLNEIFLGNRSYGVAAAALNYFDKSLDELTIGRGGAAGRPAQGAVELRSGRQSGRRPAAPRLCARPHAGGRLHHRGRGGRRPGRADRPAAALGDADRRGRLLHRGGPPAARRPARRGGILRGRAVGARDASSRRCRPPPTAPCGTGWPTMTDARAGAARGDRSTSPRPATAGWRACRDSTRASSSVTGGEAWCCRAKGGQGGAWPGRRQPRRGSAPTM